MVHSQLKGDEKARVEFAERLAELRKGGVADWQLLLRQHCSGMRRVTVIIQHKPLLQ
jgi:hypothetical protein